MTFNWNNPYPTTRIPVFARNIASTSHPLAAQAGLKIMQQGGNAVDASIATAAVLMVVEPVSNGLGSDMFAIVWDGEKLHGLNASGTAPQAWSPEYYEKKYGIGTDGFANRPLRGWDTVTIPGAIAGWQALHNKFGKLSFTEILAPAIDIANQGHAIAPIVAHKWAAGIPALIDQPGFKEMFMPNGRAPHIGERFQALGMAKAFERICKYGTEDFYQGEIAQAIVNHSKAHGGSMQLSDLQKYQPDWVDLISTHYRGYDIHEIPPSGQGIGALIALGILENLRLEDYPVDSVLSQHLQIEAMKLAFADVYQYVADPKSMRVQPSEMLDPAYLRERAKLIKLDQATHFKFGMPSSGGTVYLTTADSSGMMVSFIQSNYMGFGSGVVVPEFGVSLQNRGVGFSLDRKSANIVAPGKRPFHTIIPAFMTKEVNGKTFPQMSFGVMGGDMQPQGHLQTVVRMLSYNQQPQSACDAPRWKVNRDFTLDVESNLNANTVEGLKGLGHQLKSIEDPYMDFGSGQFIWRQSEDLNDGYVAASDSRRDGLAAGF
ncbi:MAG: gamma-glutamyltransferase family protein [Betaproteobacteria bacterium]